MQDLACVTVLVASVGLTAKVSASNRRLNAICTIKCETTHSYILHVTTVWLCCGWRIVPVIQVV